MIKQYHQGYAINTQNHPNANLGRAILHRCVFFALTNHLIKMNYRSERIRVVKNFASEGDFNVSMSLKIPYTYNQVMRHVNNIDIMFKRNRIWRLLSISTLQNITVQYSKNTFGQKEDLKVSLKIFLAQPFILPDKKAITIVYQYP